MCCSLQVKTVPQLGHLRFLSAKQQRNPKGIRKRAKKIDAQAGEAVFRDTNPADPAASEHEDGVGRIPGDCGWTILGVAGGDPRDEVELGYRNNIFEQ